MKILRHFLMLGSSLLMMSCDEHIDYGWENHCVLINKLDTSIEVKSYDCSYDDVVSGNCDKVESYTIPANDTLIISGSVGSSWLSTNAVIEFYLSDSLFRTNHHYKYWEPLLEADSSEYNAYYFYVIDTIFLKMAVDSTYSGL